MDTARQAKACCEDRRFPSIPLIHQQSKECRKKNAWFKGGHTPWTGNMVICLERRMRCVVMLANDVRAERTYPDLARKVLGETRMPWRWEYNDGDD